MEALDASRNRIQHLERFYSLLDRLELTLGGARTLDACRGGPKWPKRGVYFFREQGEIRRNLGGGQRVVRVGTHALKAEARSTLWGRLSQHKGRAGTGLGNHRGSIFRLLVGTALMAQRGISVPTWGKGSSAPRDVRAREAALEAEVSKVIGGMPFLWLTIDDEPGSSSLRAHIEGNSIALLSNYGKPPVDPPSTMWLGSYCARAKVRESGLWNQDFVDKPYDPSFLDSMEKLMGAA